MVVKYIIPISEIKKIVFRGEVNSKLILNILLNKYLMERKALRHKYLTLPLV